MSETPILNAPVYPHGYVTGRYLTAVADGPDDDHLMDFTPAKGKVIFTPETVIRRHEGPSPALVVQRPVECPINSQGYLTSPDGWRGVSLIVGIYSVRFEVQGAQVPGPKRIQVKASHTQDAPLDLVLSMPEVVPPGSVVVVDETTAQRAEAAAARAEAVVTNLESEVRAVVLASPELKGKQGDKGDKGDPGAPGALANASSYILVGPGRPDRPATTNGVIKGSEPVGAEYRSTDGAGDGLFDWRKRPTGWKIAGSGSGIEEVSGTVTLDSTGAPIREFYTTGATTFKANGTDTLISSFTAVVWRRNAQGSWGYQVVQDGWVTPAATPDTTAPVAGTLAVTVTDVKADLVASGASDDRGSVQYSFSKDNGATWTAYQDAASYSFTGLTASTSYQFRHRVKDAAGNVTTGVAVTKATTETQWGVLYTDDFNTAADGASLAGRSLGNGAAWQAHGTRATPTASGGAIATSGVLKIPVRAGKRFEFKYRTYVTTFHQAATLFFGGNAEASTASTDSIMVNGYQLRVKHSPIKIELASLSAGTNNSQAKTIIAQSDTVGLSLGQWSEVVVSMESGVLTVKVNGAVGLTYSMPDYDPAPDSYVVLQVGASSGNGIVDDVSLRVAS